MRLNTCPCCGSPLLRHARQRGIYWFCTSCRQEMMPLMGESSSRDLVGGRTRTPQSVNS
jgi:ribosomal protein L37AE/L43A